MKKNYRKPLLEVWEVSTKQIIALSGGASVLDWDNIEGDVWGSFK